MPISPPTRSPKTAPAAPIGPPSTTGFPAEVVPKGVVRTLPSSPKI